MVANQDGGSMETTSYLQMMIDSLKMKRSLLKEISKLNEEQRQLVIQTSMDEDAFQKNLDKKGELIDNLNKLDDGFQNVFERIKSELEVNRSAYKEQIQILKTLIKEVTDLGVTVEAQEARNKIVVQSKFNSMRKDLQQAKRSTKMANTYYQNMNKISADPQFMDQKK